MDVGELHASRHSEEDFSKRFLLLVDSGAGVVHVRAQEPLRAVACLRHTILKDGGQYKEWDVVNGTREFLLENCNDEGVPGDDDIDLSSSLAAPLGTIRDTAASENVRFFVYVNPQHYIGNNPYVEHLLMLYNEFLPSYRVCVVLVTPDEPLPESAVSESILSLKFHTPGLNEMKRIVRGIADMSRDSLEIEANLEEDEYSRICHTGSGLTALQFETYLSLGVVNAARDKKESIDANDLIKEVQKGKTEIVNASDLLELYEASSIDDVGGMENLKDWIKRRSNCYSDEARKFGVEPPKGLVLVGPPGTGKSLVARSVSSVLGVPLVRMDFGRVFSSYVGSSEQRIRKALEHIEAMSPVVVLADEIDKGLGGIANSGGSDSGVSMRVLGAFLTWLQDCKYPVFTVMTANNIDGLPPELLRRGRLDAIFSTSLPGPRERTEVLRIHLRKRGRSIDEFSESDIKSIVDSCDRYIPAEIESAVKDALVDAFSEGEDLAARHIIQALKQMIPLSKTFADKIERMDNWAKNNATPVSRPEKATTSPVGQRTRVSTRRRS